jgi:hypothetical protein
MHVMVHYVCVALANHRPRLNHTSRHLHFHAFACLQWLDASCNELTSIDDAILHFPKLKVCVFNVCVFAWVCVCVCVCLCVRVIHVCELVTSQPAQKPL